MMEREELVAYLKIATGQYISSDAAHQYYHQHMLPEAQPNAPRKHAAEIEQRQ